MCDDKPICLGCKDPIVNELVKSPRCRLSYHPGCVRSIKTLEDGAYTRCCNPRSRSPIDPSGSS